MGPALHHIFCRAGPACPAGGVQRLSDGGLGAARPTHLSIKDCTKYVESFHTNTIEP